MRYYFEDYSDGKVEHAEVYKCNHEIYSKCTLYKFNGKGLAVIQEYFNPDLKVFYYGPIDPRLIEPIFSQKRFHEKFAEYAKEPVDGIYPTICVRQLMWELRMKPLKRVLSESSQKLHPI